MFVFTYIATYVVNLWMLDVDPTITEILGIAIHLHT